jgi:chromosome segregation ATPase|tara:strand:- start:4 stop:375 length:372 start_codon:yes stop_codon:yes gene_type:complete
MKSRLEKVYSKLPNQKVNLKAQKVELGLMDDLRERKASVDEAIEFAKTDKQAISEAISKIRMALTEIPDNYRNADALEEDFLSFSDKADELGIEIPQEVRDADAAADELRRVTEELEKLINGL